MPQVSRTVKKNQVFHSDLLQMQERVRGRGLKPAGNAGVLLTRPVAQNIAGQHHTGSIVVRRLRLSRPWTSRYSAVVAGSSSRTLANASPSLSCRARSRAAYATFPAYIPRIRRSASAWLLLASPLCLFDNVITLAVTPEKRTSFM